MTVRIISANDGQHCTHGVNAPRHARYEHILKERTILHTRYPCRPYFKAPLQTLTDLFQPSLSVLVAVQDMVRLHLTPARAVSYKETVIDVNNIGTHSTQHT